MPIGWNRPELLVSVPVRTWVAGGLTAAVATLAVFRAASPTPATVIPLSTPPAVITVKPAPATVTVMPAPAPVAPIIPASLPEPTPEAVVHAATPVLHTDCFIDGRPYESTMETPAYCSWETGFPAISGDGTTIAVLDSDGDGERGFPNLAIRLYDAKNGRTVRTYTVLAADEYDMDHPERSAKLAQRRARPIQPMLDAGHYRTLVPLPIYEPNSERADPDFPEKRENFTSLYADVEGDAMRVIDPIMETAVWQGTIGVAAPRPWSEQEDCSGWTRFDLGIAWDPPTGHALVTTVYRTGGCMCMDITSFAVRTFPAVTDDY